MSHLLNIVIGMGLGVVILAVVGLIGLAVLAS